MPNLSLSNTTKSVRRIKGVPGIVKDNLVLSHNYQTKSVAPLINHAAFFDGSNSEIVTPLSASVFDNDFTITAWVKMLENHNSYRTIVGARDGNNDLIEFYIISNSSGSVPNHISLAMGVGTGTHWNTSSEKVLAEDGWTHVACTFTPGEQKIYKNGDSTDFQTGGDRTSAAFDVDANVIIGNMQENSSHDFRGHMCNVGIWTSVLTQSEIKSVMNKNYAGLTDSEKTNLVSWWNLDSQITENYDAVGEGDDTPSTIDNLVYDNHDTTLTEVSFTNSDFTSGSGIDITDWQNTAANKWERSGDTIISPNGVSLLRRASVLTNNVAHKVIVKAKNTMSGQTAQLRVYFGGNNHATYNLTDDFQEYTFHGLQANDTTLILYNPSGADSTNVTIDWVKLYKYDGNVGILL